MDEQEQKQAKKLEKSQFVQALKVDCEEMEVPQQDYEKMLEASKILLGTS